MRNRSAAVHDRPADLLAQEKATEAKEHLPSGQGCTVALYLKAKMGSRSKISMIMRHGILMRESFHFNQYKVAQWFPGHMGKGVSQLHKKIKSVDCVIEVHDARIPISGRNPLFEVDVSSIKPHVLVLNKVDLIDYDDIPNILKYYNDRGTEKVFFTNCKNAQTKVIKKLIPFVLDVVSNSPRYHRELVSDYNIMIIGVPNVGKSSLINALRVRHLRKGKATSVGAAPGITKSVLEKIKISDDPRVYILDTPGILAPKIKSVEVGLKLALVNTIKDHLVGEDIIADYLLFRMNLEGNHRYVEYLNLDEPTDDIQKVLVLHAMKNNMILKLRRYVPHGGLDSAPDTLRAAKYFLQGFRIGKFGPLKLDHELYS